MKRIIKVLIAAALIVVAGICLIGCEKKTSLPSEYNDYQHDISVLRMVEDTFNKKLSDSKYEELEAVITYTGQQGFVLDSPMQIKSENEELVNTLLKEITSEILNEYKFDSKRLKANDELVLTIKDKKVTMQYDKDK